MVKTKRTLAKAKKAKTKRNNNTSQEVTRLGALLRQLGSLGGGAIGSLVGSTAGGASAGHSIGAALSRWLGSGDYRVSSNSIVNSMKASGAIPAMHNNDQSVVIRHKEFVGEVKGSINFNVAYALPINPGMSITFPWLASVANCYQQYRIKGMVYHYVPTSGASVSSANPALGSVMFQTSYRASDSPPASKVEMLNEYWSTESVPCEATCHPIECNPAENPYNVQYVRGKPVPSGDNVLLYDLGTTYICTSGQQTDGGILGDVWITYEIELKKPLISSSVTTGETLYTSFDQSAAATFTSVFGGSTKQTVTGNLQLTLANNTITIPAEVVGLFRFTFWIQASTTFTSPVAFGSLPTTTNCVLGLIDDVYNSYYTVSAAGTLGGAIVAFEAIKRAHGQATITLPTYTVSGGTIARVSFYVVGDTNPDN